jgi:uncharacterized Ntn-hydrolase superfamily protein
MITPYRPSTFSIVAHDPEAQEWGVAVASKFLAVGSVVPWAQAGVGAIATQSYANTTYGPAGLTLLAQRYAAEDALQGLIAADFGRAERQAGIVDSEGRAATYTGESCYPWAGGRTGQHFAAQGNILTGKEVVNALAETFEGARGTLADRLFAALSAGQDAGGDSRGQQSAALLVVKSRGGYAGFNDRYVDLRVDDHPQPIAELGRILDIHKLLMFKTQPHDVLMVDEALARQIQDLVRRSGAGEIPVTGRYDEPTQRAFRALCGRENLEGRWREGREVDRVVLDYLLEKYATGAQ